MKLRTHFPLVPKRDLKPGDVWAGDGRNWNTEPPVKDMDEKVLLLQRNGVWAHEDR